MRIWSVVSIAGLFYMGQSYALYNGSPSLPGMPEENLFLGEDSPVSLKAEAQGSLTLSRQVRISSGSSPCIRSSLAGGEVSLGFIDRVEIYVLLAQEKTRFSGRKRKESFHLETTNHLGGEIGARATAIFWGETKLGFDAKYFYSWPSISSLSVEGRDRSARTSKAWEQQWQVGVALSQRWAFFTPYVGAKYSRMSLNFMGLSSLGGSLEVENTSPFGIFVGLGIAGQKGPFLDIEASFLDDYTFSGALGLRF